MFDEAKRRPHDQRGRGNDQSTIFNVRFDSLEVQRKATKTDKDALDSQYNFFAKETLFKRRLNHVDGRPCSSSDDRAFYEVNPEAARLRRLPSSSEDSSNLASSSGRSAGRLAEPGLAPHNSSCWRCNRGGEGGDDRGITRLPLRPRYRPARAGWLSAADGGSRPESRRSVGFSRLVCSRGHAAASRSRRSRLAIGA